MLRSAAVSVSYWVLLGRSVVVEILACWTIYRGSEKLGYNRYGSGGGSLANASFYGNYRTDTNVDVSHRLGHDT
jgi:hypothetical protein